MSGDTTLISPTGKGMRNDPQGAGHYRAARGGRWHDGADFLCDPGQEVVAPISGRVTRIARPYAVGPFLGLEIEGRRMAVALFYVEPLAAIQRALDHGKSVPVKKGETIAHAQDIAAKYGGGMLPHVHLRITSADPWLFLEPFNRPDEAA